MGKKAARRAEDYVYSGGEAAKRARDRFDFFAKELGDEGRGLRQQAIGFHRGILQGGPEAQRVLAPQIEAVRREGLKSREFIDRTLPRGGARMRALRQQAIGESGQVGRLFTERMDRALQELQELGLFGTRAGLQATQGVLQTAQPLLGAGQAMQGISSAQRQGVAGGAATLGRLAAMFLSSEELKDQIVPFDDFEESLKSLMAQPMFRFRYKEGIGQDHSKEYIGMIAEKTDPDYVVVDQDGSKGIDLGYIIGMMMGAIKAQQERIVELEGKLRGLDTYAKVG